SAEDPGDERPSRLILLGGVALPSVVLIIVLAFTVRTMHTIPNAAPEGALQIEVVGHQWWWEIRYPQHGIVTANEIHLPVGRPVEFLLTSADVIHSFWIPELGGKLDLLPEDVNTLVLQADAPGVYRSQCAEFCGLQHAKMRLLAVAEPEGRFSEWLAREQRPARATASSSGAAGGEQLFADVGCASCHTVRGTSADGTAGPDLTHLASRRTLAAATVPNDREHLEGWITDPHAIKEGVEMPATELDERQRRLLIQYLEGLR
ncbi:MAG: cytochrome c oxidase subunit II, partial [Actinobacteria bacterium]|nr:cytochrome c oxidase subunit II [Actinomycetota bacterium]